ncbi:hypothetical protein ACH5RR_016786 [Cinchona calisaya]|uniref:Tetratricopeptide repeat-like superfamily protein n=1 Tax=Cinchona calisaya TaxID=153742 RepID=A0ABD3A0K3_9GENT
MMKLNMSPVGLECSHQAFPPSITKSSSVKERKRDRSVVCQAVLSSPFRSRKLLKSQNFTKQASRVHRITRSCSTNFDEGFGMKDNGDEGCCAISETEPSKSRDGLGEMFPGNSFWQSDVEVLEPTMLGIRPDPPDWPERELIMWVDIEQKAKRFDLPLSLRMIKKKHQRKEGYKEIGKSVYPSVGKAFSSMVSIVVELQSCALQMGEALCNEDFEMIISQVQRDMHSSFVWLFQQVFSRTPALMVSMMILLTDFCAYSTSHNVAIAQTSLCGSLCEKTEETGSVQHSQIDNSSMASTTLLDNERGGRGANLIASETDVVNEDSSYLSTKYLKTNPEEILQNGNQEFRSVAEVSLWNSFLDEATKMQSGPSGLVPDHDVLQKFVSPVSVEVEPDDYMEYLRTDVMYQMVLSQDPKNPLLLCNYAQFLHLVAHDYDRAEECFKRAIQAELPDAESLSRYADFLWTVRKDLWRAEDTYLQALSIEPENPYHASKYANFLWNTGGEETCFPLDASNNNTKSPNV